MPTGTVTDRRKVVLLDSSAAVALLIEDHEAHAATMNAVHGYRLGLAGHAWFETFSVLTRLPAGRRRSPSLALNLLRRNFPASAFLDEQSSMDLGDELARLEIAGGAVYDALVGAAARQHRRRLLSSDRRARPTYEALGVEFMLIDQR
jgi:predicted nucleic acid-binding protein